MSRNWIRKIKLSIGGAKNVDVSNLRVQFDVYRQTYISPNTSTFRIYNLKKDTAKEIVEGADQGKKVKLEAGYEDNFGQIFQGTTIFAASGRESPTDTYVDVYCHDGGAALQEAQVSKTFPKDTTDKDIFEHGLERMAPWNITRGIITGLSDKKAPKAQTFHGMAVPQIFTTLARNSDARVWIDNEALNFAPLDTSISQGNFIELNTGTGLIGMPIATPKGIIVTALINPAFQPGKVQLLIENKYINMSRWNIDSIGGIIGQQLAYSTLGVDDGTYEIDAIEFRGDTHAQDWYAIMWCHGAKTGSPATWDNIIKEPT
jgi:hypothetical protein